MPHMSGAFFKTHTLSLLMQIPRPVAYITPKRDRGITYPQATGVSTETWLTHKLFS